MTATPEGPEIASDWAAFSGTLPPRGTLAAVKLAMYYADALLEFDADHRRALEKALGMVRIWVTYRRSGLIDAAGEYHPQ